MREHLFTDDGPNLSPSLVQESMFYMAGQLMAHSLLQGGPSPNILPKWAFSIITQPNGHTIIDVPSDFYQQEIIKKMIFDSKNISSKFYLLTKFL